MNGMKKEKPCETTDRDDDEEEDLAQPSTSRAGLSEEPQWNTSTRQLYHDNLKMSSTSRVGDCRRCPDFRPRERLPSIADSTSSDDSCVYMYKGEDGQRNQADVNKRVECSSPEMDYLEMDFDPCQSNGQDSSDGSYCCDVAELKEEEAVAEVEESHLNPIESNEEEKNPTSSSAVLLNPSPITLPADNAPSEVPQLSSVNNRLQGVAINSSEQVLVIDSNENINQQENDKLCNAQSNSDPRTLESNYLPQTQDPNNKSQDDTPLNEDGSELNVILKKHLLDTASQYNSRFGYVPCCLTTLSRAVHSMISEEYTIEDFQEEFNNVDISITELLSKLSYGFLTNSKIQNIINKASDGAVTTRFFQSHPSILVKLSSWLLHWLNKDAVIVLCLNFNLNDKECSEVVNSSWHYQLVHSVSPKGIQVVSQIEAVHEEIVKKLLMNPSEVLIMKDYIMTHWTPTSNLKPLLNCDSSWRQYNVLGQVVNVIRDTMTGKSDDEIRYVKIPSPHRTGFLLMMRSDNVHLKDLIDAEEFLPLL